MSVAGFVLWLVLSMEYKMSTAVLARELYKRFNTPGLQVWGRTTRLSSRTSGHASLSFPALVVVALDHVSFSVPEGEIFGICGASESGKTTLIRLLATLLQPDEGELQIFGLDAARQPRQVLQLVNRVSMEASFFKKLSPIDNLFYNARLYGLNGSETRRLAGDLLVRLGLEPQAIQRPMEEMNRLSQQKVAIANALLMRSRLLLLDEPTRGLDQQTKGEVLRMLREMREANGTTIVITAEEIAEVEGVCDQLAVLENGKLAALDTPEGLRRQHLFQGLRSILQQAPEKVAKLG
jgi:ABC-2 type transport system ATP-binding protein